MIFREVQSSNLVTSIPHLLILLASVLCLILFLFALHVGEGASFISEGVEGSRLVTSIHHLLILFVCSLSDPVPVCSPRGGGH